MSTGGVLIVIALVIWGLTEAVDLVARRVRNRTLASYDERPPGWVSVLNVGALVLASAGFVLWLVQDERNFGIGL
ncbi:hypothetical protein [Ornithinimicrobium murale]|uniref:hypothetical protein n=1 Tax=Ornithinimicrobium murale TaxID=1050153 RepID=UPI000E0CDE6E|nr:hypothetical protein [Ornithinimicrobium murale]